MPNHCHTNICTSHEPKKAAEDARGAKSFHLLMFSYQNDLACIGKVKKTALAINFCFSSFDTNWKL